MTLARSLSPALLLFSLLAAGAALAGRPLSTEDASVLEDGRCQVEAWLDRSRDATVGWFVPACNFGANIEWQIGFARTWMDGSNRSTDSYFQAKTVFREIDEASPWAVGLVAGVTRHLLQETHRGWQNPYVIVPLSFQAGKVLVHLNAGWARDRATKRDVTLWGAAAEWPVTEKVTLLGEAFGENSERPFLRIGGRWNVTESVALDLSWVSRSGGTREERFVSLGVFWESGRFLK